MIRTNELEPFLQLELTEEQSDENVHSIDVEEANAMTSKEGDLTAFEVVFASPDIQDLTYAISKPAEFAQNVVVFAHVQVLEGRVITHKDVVLSEIKNNSLGITVNKDLYRQLLEKEPATSLRYIHKDHLSEDQLQRLTLK